LELSSSLYIFRLPSVNIKFPVLSWFPFCSQALLNFHYYVLLHDKPTFIVEFYTLNG